MYPVRMTWMIYGASGYTGELIAREAKRRGLVPILAGRTLSKLAPLAQELGFEARAFALSSAVEIAQNLEGVAVVLNCAGPFSRTAAPMMAACLTTGTHYLDITGEIPVLESAHGHNAAAVAANIVICPGAGFDVVPTDCAAAMLKAALPEAEELWLGFDAGQRMSPGTAKTMMEYAGQGGKVRRGGKITPYPVGAGIQTLDFGRGPTRAMPVPWGDVASAYYSTGIPNITVFTPMPIGLELTTRALAVLTRSAAVTGWLQNLIGARLAGPTAEQREAGPAYVFGRVTAPDGRTKEIRLTTPNGYTLTVLSAVAMTEHLLAGDFTPGVTTPSRLMGASFILSLLGTKLVTPP